MSISPVSAVLAVKEKLSAGGSGKPSTGFADLVGQIAEKVKNPAMRKDFSDLANMQNAIEGGKSFSPRELVLYQVKASRLHLHVELVSKGAETVHATARRLQQGQ
jgi:hypothetical protein